MPQNPGDQSRHTVPRKKVIVKDTASRSRASVNQTNPTKNVAPKTLVGQPDHVPTPPVNALDKPVSSSNLTRTHNAPARKNLCEDGAGKHTMARLKYVKKNTAISGKGSQKKAAPAMKALVTKKLAKGLRKTQQHTQPLDENDDATNTHILDDNVSTNTKDLKRKRPVAEPAMSIDGGEASQSSHKATKRTETLSMRKRSASPETRYFAVEDEWVYFIIWNDEIPIKVRIPFRDYRKYPVTPREYEQGTELLRISTYKTEIFPTLEAGDMLMEQDNGRHGIYTILEERYNQDFWKRWKSYERLWQMWAAEAFPSTMKEEEKQWYKDLKEVMSNEPWPEEVSFRSLAHPLRQTIIEEILEGTAGVYTDNSVAVRYLLHIDQDLLKLILAENADPHLPVSPHLLQKKLDCPELVIDPDEPSSLDLAKAIFFLKNERLPASLLGEWYMSNVEDLSVEKLPFPHNPQVTTSATVADGDSRLPSHHNTIPSSEHLVRREKENGNKGLGRQNVASVLTEEADLMDISYGNGHQDNTGEALAESENGPPSQEPMEISGSFHIPTRAVGNYQVPEDFRTIGAITAPERLQAPELTRSSQSTPVPFPQQEAPEGPISSALVNWIPPSRRAQNNPPPSLLLNQTTETVPTEAASRSNASTLQGQSFHFQAREAIQQLALEHNMSQRVQQAQEQAVTTRTQNMAEIMRNHYKLLSPQMPNTWSTDLKRNRMPVDVPSGQGGIASSRLDKQSTQNITPLAGEAVKEEIQTESVQNADFPSPAPRQLPATGRSISVQTQNNRAPSCQSPHNTLQTSQPPQTEQSRPKLKPKSKKAKQFRMSAPSSSLAATHPGKYENRDHIRRYLEPDDIIAQPQPVQQAQGLQNPPPHQRSILPSQRIDIYHVQVGQVASGFPRQHPQQHPYSAAHNAMMSQSIPSGHALPYRVSLLPFGYQQFSLHNPLPHLLGARPQLASQQTTLALDNMNGFEGPISAPQQQNPQPGTSTPTLPLLQPNPTQILPVTTLAPPRRSTICSRSQSPIRPLFPTQSEEASSQSLLYPTSTLPYDQDQDQGQPSISPPSPRRSYCDPDLALANSGNPYYWNRGGVIGIGEGERAEGKGNGEVDDMEVDTETEHGLPPNPWADGAVRD
ncbi:hypothetical protein B0J11DRAFT_613762 [Dendryphion nanum]|uniref:Uncharacterized protein n=1 Tax=Dendryphion nanum TaxID=256645 RepID=A0A9P9IQ97_9PLEO|nr:hypothetical protein B0J11DRAFT_613762 [Dendryphion nanum]